MQQFGYDSRVCHVVRLRCEWYRDRTPVGTHLGSGATGPRSPQPAVSTKHEARITQLPAVQPLAFVLLPWCFLYPAARIPSGRLPLVGRGYLPAAPECTGPVVVAMLDLVVRMLLWCSLLCALPMCSRRTSVRSLERSAAAGFALLAAGGVRARSCVGMLLQENVPRGNFLHRILPTIRGVGALADPAAFTCP